MTFLLLWWAASQPVETCKVTLDVESTPAGLRHMEQRLRRSVSFVYTNTHSLMHTQSCVVSLHASFLQTHNPDMIWNTVRPQLLPSWYASDVEEESMCLHLSVGDFSCMCVHAYQCPHSSWEYIRCLNTLGLLYVEKLYIIISICYKTNNLRP